MSSISHSSVRQNFRLAWLSLGVPGRDILCGSRAFYQFFRPTGCVLTSTVTVKNGRLRAVWISPHRHTECVLNEGLSLCFPNRPPNDPTGSNIQNTTYMQLTTVVFQFCNIGTPQRIWYSYGEFILEQVLLQVYFLLGRGFCLVALRPLFAFRPFFRRIRAIFASLT